uniref:Uncharacterized protein n=1 Tax=Plectus sambesii TaxID=2011161 RepID=A0A914X5W7_9BILA
MKKPTKMCPEVAQSIRSTMFESGEDNQFSRVMQPIFTIMVVLGLQPFASSKRSSESKASILKRLYNRYFTFGFFFWLPLPFIGCRATFLSMKAYANTVQKYGFFDSTTVSIMQTWLLVQIGWIFAIYAFVFASRIVTMIGKFDEILLSPLALSHFRKVTYALSDHYAFSLAYSFIHLDALLGICLSAISLNDEARAIQCDLHDYVPESFEVYVLMGKFDRKASDSGWGFTMGRMFLLEKRKFVALFGAMLTFIALWSQFAQHENGCQSSNSTTSVNLIVELGLYF